PRVLHPFPTRRSSDLDWSVIRVDHPGKRIATNHMILNLTAVGLYVVNIVLRTGARNDAHVAILPFVLSLAGVGLISVSGYLGGRSEEHTSELQSLRHL